MIPKIFSCYYSKTRGPPRLRFQVMGQRGRKFYKLVAANQRDPKNGKHMEVLGSVQHKPSVQPTSHIESPHMTLTEIRLRFSRIKFWLAVGCQFNTSVANALYSANLIPHPPPKYGLRTCGHYEELKKIYNREQQVSRDQLNYFYKMGGRPEFIPTPTQSEHGDETPAEIVSRALYPPLMREHMHANAHVTSDHDKELDSSGHLIRKVAR